MYTFIALFFIFIGISFWILVYSRGYWWLKVPTISVGCFFLLLLMNGIDTVRGWPNATIPDKFEILAVEIREPSVVNKDGQIFLWISPIQYSQPWYSLWNGDTNSTYNLEVPYSEEARRQAESTQDKIKNGEKVYGSKSKKGGKGKSGKKGNGKKGDDSNLNNDGSKRGNRGMAWKGHDENLFYVMPESPMKPEPKQ